MSSHERAPRPHPKVHPKAWNKYWEEDLARSYGADGNEVVPLSHRVVMLFELQPEDIESSQLCLSVATKEVCRLQDDLASLAARQFSNDDFEKKWAQLTDTRRGALVLEALVAAASVGPDMESRRNWCPEMTVEFLARDRGKNLIDLLDQLMPEDLTQPITEPLFIPNKAVDLLFQPLCKRAARGLYVERAYFLTLVLWRILLAFYELKEDYIIGKSPRSSGSETKSTLQPLSELLGKEYIQTVKKVYKAERAEQAHTCWECGKPEEAGKKLLACSGCRSIGRWIRYCSTDCQRKDWKRGIPVPHKQICGKPLTENAIAAAPKLSSPVTNGLIPTPSSSFKRRPALLQQLIHLQRAPFPDYVFTTPDQVIRTFLSQNRLEFLILRRRALATGDSRAVNGMFHMLSSHTSGYITEDQLKKQLGNEYGVAVETKSATPSWSASKREREDVSNALALLLSEDTSTDDRIPVADPSFRRSPALIRQTTLLNQPPFVDYVIMFPPPHDDRGIHFFNPILKAKFLAMRRRALKIGDKTAVSTMFLMLVPYAEVFGRAAQDVWKQLEEEYGPGCVVPGLVMAEPPTAEELEREQKLIKRNEQQQQES